MSFDLTGRNTQELNDTLNSIVDNPTLKTVGTLLLVTLGKNILPSQQLPMIVSNLMNNLVIRLSFLFLVVYSLTKNINTSLLIVGGLYLLQNNENFTIQKIQSFEKFKENQEKQQIYEKACGNSKKHKEEEEEEDVTEDFEDDEEERFESEPMEYREESFSSFDKVPMEKFSNKKKRRYNPRSSYFRR